MPTDDFQGWVQRVIGEKFKHNTELAGAIGLTVSGFLKGVKVGTLSTESLLRLARAVGEDPSVVLKKAGKADVAALIEGLYGPPRVVAAHVREFERLTTNPPLPSRVVQRHLEELQEYRDFQLQLSASGNAPAGGEAAGRRTRSKRAVREK